jgi:acyl-coenzyme A synthetase/AMP-(fatty) acid ligase/acyl carrier protein
VTILLPPTAPVPLPFADDLARHGDAGALLTAGETVTYRELDRRVEDRCRQFGPERRLVLATASNTVEAVVTYLAALRGTHPVLLAPPGEAGAVAALAETYDPDIVATEHDIVERRSTTAHDLHPDLALLLSTSGSTGTPKLVRLSRTNLDANATAIGAYLSLTPADRAITTLPIQYCYGLSVLNSHLHAGAGVVLTELSVVDTCFWELFRRVGATSFAGVPHTFDLLDRVGFDELDLPTLRYVTQAGGRMRADNVRRYAALGAARGWELFVMYGQTEATARMAYLPPALAATHPTCIGVPIPGGELSIESPDSGGVGELVYRGDNVMLGYAEGPRDLALGRTVHALHTGDLARRTSEGLFELAGRSSRFVKPFGVRVDLDHLEQHLAARGFDAICTGDDDQLVVGVTSAADTPAVAVALDEQLGLPPAHRHVVALDEIPRRHNGKPDYEAVRRAALDRAGGETTGEDAEDPLREAFARVLALDPASIPDHATFVSLGGDSLSYVEMSVRLEALLGTLPREWHRRTVGELAETPVVTRRRWARLDTSVVLRAIAIVLVVGSHADLWERRGGAHALLALAGFSFGRFQVEGGSRWASIARVAAPSACWIGALALFSDKFAWRHALFLNGVLDRRGSSWSFWFVEALVQILVVVALILAIPAVRRHERRHPFRFAMGAVGLGLLVRFDVIADLSLRHRVFRPQEIFWLFALGWAAAQARRRSERVLVSAVAAVAMAGFFGDGMREVLVLATLGLVIWIARFPVPRRLVGSLSAVASASLAIYLVHMPLHMPIERTFGPAPAFAVSMVAGLAGWQLLERVSDGVSRAARGLPALRELLSALLHGPARRRRDVVGGDEGRTQERVGLRDLVHPTGQ